MILRGRIALFCLITAGFVLSLSSCKGKTAGDSQEPPDLNAMMRPYVTTADAKVKAGPGAQFRTIAQIPRNAKVQVVGKDGDWLLIVSKKGNAPGFIESALVQPSLGEESESPAPKVEGRFEALTNTQLRSGPGLHYPVVADISKGTKLNVVAEEHGWLKVESKRGNKPGYLDATFARSLER